MVNRLRVAVVAAVFVAVGLGASIGAFSYARRTAILTFSGPFALPGASLPAGSYQFELVDTSTNVNIVRVTSRRGNAGVVAKTLPVPRPEDMSSDIQVTFSEVNKGQPPRITAWYPTGEPIGRAFVY